MGGGRRRREEGGGRGRETCLIIGCAAQAPSTSDITSLACTRGGALDAYPAATVARRERADGIVSYAAPPGPPPPASSSSVGAAGAMSAP